MGCWPLLFVLVPNGMGRRVPWRGWPGQRQGEACPCPSAWRAAELRLAGLEPVQLRLLHAATALGAIAGLGRGAAHHRILGSS